MRTVHCVRRTDINDYTAVAFTEKDDAQQWIIDTIMPDYRKIWCVNSIKVYESMSEYKGGSS